MTLIDERYEEIFPSCLCPLAIFKDIMHINDLRRRAKEAAMDFTTGTVEAMELLVRIHAFSPEQWAKPRAEFKEELTLLATMYHCATMLYCILSLQDLALLDRTLPLRAMRAAYADMLFDAMKQAFVFPEVKSFSVWIITIAGVEAAERGTMAQAWVDEQLTTLRHEYGVGSSLIARNMLRKFWRSRQAGWENCFDQPCAVTS